VNFRRRTLLAALPAMPLALHAAGEDPAYPSRPVKVIVPYSPGTGPDVLARTVLEQVGRRLGQPVLVDNRTGASGNIGTELIARAAPDGYTLGIVTNAFAMNPSLGKVGYDPLKDFAPIGLVARNALVLVAKPTLGVRNVQGLAARAKAQPGRLTYATPGSGSPQHLGMSLLEHVMQVDLMQVPYRGTGPSITGMLAGEVDCMLMGPSAAAPFIRDGKLVALAVSTRARHPLLPDVPTLEESGVKGVEVDLWYAVLAPARTPPQVLKVLREEVENAMGQPAIASDLRQKGMIPEFLAAQQFEALLRHDVARWAEVIRRARITVD
jgi:tripartite-type tricarboxylate transporter receptor subunit TctC